MAKTTKTEAKTEAKTKKQRSTKKDGTQKVKKTITKPKKLPAHPPASQMVRAALKDLKNRKGVSFQAIKKYLAEKYNCEYTNRNGRFVRDYISKEYEAGRIRMADKTKEVLNFRERLKLVA